MYRSISRDVKKDSKQKTKPAVGKNKAGGVVKPAIIIRLNPMYLEMMSNVSGLLMADILERYVYTDVFSFQNGSCLFSITNLTITQFNGDFEYELLPPDSFNWGFTDGKATVFASWVCDMVNNGGSKKRHGDGRRTGEFIAFVKDLAANVNVTMLPIDEQEISFEVTNCTFEQAEVDYYLVGIGGFKEDGSKGLKNTRFLNPFLEILCPAFEKALYQVFAAQINPFYNDVIPIGVETPLFLNASFVSKPIINTTCVDIPVNGEVLGVTRNTLQRVELDTSQCRPEVDRCVFVSDYTVNTLLYQAFQGGLLNLTTPKQQQQPVCASLSLSQAPTVLVNGKNSSCMVNGSVVSTYNQTNMQPVTFNTTGIYNARASWNQLYGNVTLATTRVAQSGLEYVLGCISEAVEMAMNIFFLEYRIELPNVDYLQWVNNTVKLLNRTHLVEQQLKMYYI